MKWESSGGAKKVKLAYEGNLTHGYYNDMEAGYPVFVDSLSMSDVVKEMLEAEGLWSNFCQEEYFKGKTLQTKNPLAGARVRVTIEIDAPGSAFEASRALVEERGGPPSGSVVHLVHHALSELDEEGDLKIYKERPERKDP